MEEYERKYFVYAFFMMIVKICNIDRDWCYN